MSAADVSIYAGVVILLLGAFGGGIKYLIDHITNQQSAARNELKDNLVKEINDLRIELARLQALNGIYLRRIYQLENFIHQHPDIDIPVMEGWPPV